MLNALLVAYSRILVRRAGPRLRRIFTAIAVHLVEVLSFGVVRFQFVITNWPGRRDAAVMTKLAEVLFAQTKQRRAIKLGIAADVIVRMWMQLLTVRIAPSLFGVVLAFEVDGARAPIVLLAGHVIAAFEQQNLLAGWCEFVCQSAAARARPDDDYVVMIGRRHD